MVGSLAFPEDSTFAVVTRGHGGILRLIPLWRFDDGTCFSRGGRNAVVDARVYFDPIGRTLQEHDRATPRSVDRDAFGRSLLRNDE